MFFALKKLIPNVDPIVIVNNFLIHWFLLNLLVRFFMQQLPVMNIKPLMIIPIKRNVVIHYLLGKTAISFFNFLSLFIFLPFTTVMLIKGYPTLNVISWLISVMCLTMVINFINFLINKNNTVFYSIATVLAVLIGLEFFGIFLIFGDDGFGVFEGMFSDVFYGFVDIFHESNVHLEAANKPP